MEDSSIDITTCSQSEFEATKLYQSIYGYVEAYMSNYDASHDFNHILRVVALAKKIFYLESQLPLNENFKSVNWPTVILAAFLHDVGDKKYVKPGDDAEHIVRDLLLSHGCTRQWADTIATVVKNVSFSNEIKNPTQVQEVLKKHPELAIVQDADRLDAIGAVGIARTFAFGAVKASARGLQGSVEHFVEKLENLEGMMKTDMGRQLARERTRRLKEFRGWWEEEESVLTWKANGSI
ncbi:Hypothetical protein R9X50_00377900 [Acrodontium crateriforme]|uniref:HD/PDEase domain-containing protein n=1 Tax=Acrodontium crateriforme TaxID=150365 RepID=A0AAQ3RA57_9PEZI|nr:Hypothetical protein R9X50_00377900 [Acrodontium crateriforme]